MITTVDVDDTPTSAVPVRAGLISVLCALGIIIVVGGLFAVAAVPLPPNGAFLPAYGAATFCVDFITAALLLAQSSILHDRARSHLGRAYLFSSLIIIPHMLSFPGVFGVESIIGNSSGAVWFWCAWHFGFPFFVIAYLRELDAKRDPVPIRIVYSIGFTLLVVAGTTALFTVGLPYLPAILINGSFGRLNTLGIGPVIVATNAVAAIMARRRMRSDSSLTTYVFIALVVSTIDVLLTLSGSARFSLGWYVARMLSLVTGLVVLVALVSELLGLLRQVTSANAQLRTLTGTDPLTGIANRRQFDQALDLEWRRALRSGHRLSLLMIDIDQFKAFNDHYGHPTGDICLKAVAAALAAVPHRPADLVARVGGEEFAVLLPDTGEDGAMEVARTLNATISALGIQHAASTAGIVTCSIGVCAQRPVASTVTSTDLVARADVALYTAKRDGRNRACLFTESDPEPLVAA
ncbi:MAG: sensor domain-containing diguanylate cyclase [Janthinobacterium lividum]